MSIILNDKNGNYLLEDCLLHKYENVLSYNYYLCSSQLILQLSSSEENVESNKEIYYVFDCPVQDPFAHWIYESFIFYPLMLKIQSIYPDVKILTKNTKKYVKNMFKFFNINNEIVNEIKNPNNICFFSPIVSLNDLDYLTDLYVKYIHLYIDNLNFLLSNNISFNNKYLLLPRNSKDNYIGNERTIHGLNDIEDNIISIGGVVLNTYQINNIELQMSITKNSEIIILDYGSSFFFNCLNVKDKTIIVLNNYAYFSNQIKFNSLKIMYDIIIKNNKVIFIDNLHKNSLEVKFDDIKKFLEL